MANDATGPIPDSYWVVTGRLLAGEYPGHRDPAQAMLKVRRFLAAGVTCFIDLTEGGELRPYLLPDGAGKDGQPPAKHWRMPIRDLHVPTHTEMVRILDLIDAQLSEGRVTYVHCWGGVGRTGTVIGCWLVRHGSSGEEAIAEIARLRRSTLKAWRASPEMPAQMRMVRTWPDGA